MAIYEVAQPTAIFYPHTAAGYNGYANASMANQWPHSVTNYVIRELKSLRYLYVAGIAGVANTEAITIPCAADGSLDYENIYNVVTGLDVNYEENRLFAVSTPAIRIPEKN